jgi:hypothetical protein
VSLPHTHTATSHANDDQDGETREGEMREGGTRDAETDVQGTRGRRDGNGEGRQQDGKQPPHPAPTMDNTPPTSSSQATAHEVEGGWSDNRKAR